MKRLALIDDVWHPGEIPRAGLSKLADFDWFEDGKDWTPELLGDYPVVVLVKANQIGPEDKTPWADEAAGDAFTDHVRRGGGLLVVHSGTSGYDDVKSLRALIGGVFAHHPPQCPVTVEPRLGHPICEGVPPFTGVDEHYFMHFDATDADVFLQSRSEAGVQPAGWTRREGAGRVCVITPGHTAAVWQHPSFLQLLANALAWITPKTP
ncbi:ThuA domain-containing protein [Luteolibacter sp. LG18]|uniref:ThuA domain-containing protein n=1 Tax=Luteolibacter sp. LG18 TaxID=2819286 RepID=UPI002B28B738|nr:hypothetical protein llg_28640 [Luteolibacter sp. LG18]